MESKAFEIRLEPVEKKDESFSVKGLQVEIKAVKPKVTSRDEVVFLVKLKNVGYQAIRISGREGSDDNYCRFLVYAPGERMPAYGGVFWPTKGTQGLVIPPGKTIEHEFRPQWGVRPILVPGGPDGHVGHDLLQTTFLTTGIHDIVAYFHGEDNTESKDCWTGDVWSNAVKVEMVPAGSLRADEAEGKAVQAIGKLGGLVTRDEKAQGKPVVWVRLDFTQVTDADLKELAALKQLQRLELMGTRVTDAGLKDLAPLTQLQALYLRGTEVTGAGLKDLAPLKQLQRLDISLTRVTGAGLKDLAPLKQLQWLDLDGNSVTDAGLKELAALTQLQRLNLSYTKVTDAGVKELAALTQLQRLDLEGTRVTDAGVKELAALTQLQKLNLRDTKVTLAGVKELAALTQLQELDLRATKVTDAGVKELATLKQLQRLDLDETPVTDACLKELAALTQLQWLSLAVTQVTGVGVKELAALTQLQELTFGGLHGLTDAGQKELAELQKALPKLRIRIWTLPPPEHK